MKGLRLHLHANMLFLLRYFFRIHDDQFCMDLLKINFIVYLGRILSIQKKTSWEIYSLNIFQKIFFYYYLNNLFNAILPALSETPNQMLALLDWPLNFPSFSVLLSFFLFVGVVLPSFTWKLSLSPFLISISSFVISDYKVLK